MSVITWPGIGLVPAPVKILGDHAELDDQIAGQVLGLDLTAFFPPEPKERILVIAHDDPGVRAADESAPICRIDECLDTHLVPLSCFEGVLRRTEISTQNVINKKNGTVNRNKDIVMIIIMPVQCRMARAALGLGIRELALAAKVSIDTITRFERGDLLKERTIEAIQRVLEAAGVEFTNGDQPGVRLTRAAAAQLRDAKPRAQSRHRS